MARISLRIAQFISIVLIGSTVVLVSLSARAERLDWDQGRVTALAVKLTQALEKTAAAAVTAPPQGTAFQQRGHDAAVRRLERVRAAAARLVTKLEAGWGHDETEAYFWQVRVLLRETQEIAGNAVHYQKMAKRWNASLEIVRELARYYGEY